MLRFSLAALLLLLAIVAIGLAGLVNANVAWQQAIATTTVILLMGSSVAAVYSRPSKPFCGGFAIAGWTYLLIAMSTFGAATRDAMATTTVLQQLQLMVHGNGTKPPQGVVQTLNGITLSLQGSGVQPNTRWVSLANPNGSQTTVELFYAIGHSLWAILFGCLGGLLATVLSRRAGRKDSANTNPVAA
jgi:hypothetical protein